MSCQRIRLTCYCKFVRRIYCSPPRIRTSILGSRNRCLAVRRTGIAFFTVTKSTFRQLFTISWRALTVLFMILSAKCPICKADISQNCDPNNNSAPYLKAYGVHQARYFGNKY